MSDNPLVPRSDDPFTISTAQINLGRGKAASEALAVLMKTKEIKIGLLQEPYQRSGKISNFKKYNFSCLFHGEGIPKAAIVITDPELDVVFLRQYSCSNLVAALVSINNLSTILISCYLEQAIPLERFFSRIEDIKRDFPDARMIVGGDFNAKSPLWGGARTDVRGDDTIAFALSLNFCILNSPLSPPTFHNRGESWINITLADCPNLVMDWEVNADSVLESLSDHRPTLFKFSIGSPRNSEVARDKIFNTHKADWSKFTYFINNNKSRFVNLINNLKVEDIEQAAACLEELVHDACEFSMPYRKPGRGNWNSWWSPQLTTPKSKIRALRRRSQKERNPEIKASIFSSFQRERGHYKRLILDKQFQSWKSICESGNSGNPFELPYKLLSGKYGSISMHARNSMTSETVLMDSGLWTKSREETTNYLISKFFPVDDPESDDLSHVICRRDAEAPITSQDDPEISLVELHDIFCNLKSNKACGPDHLPAAAMSHLWGCLADHLLSLYQCCLRSGYFPKVWKKAKIILIPKSSGCGFRPISLLSILGKILDKLLATRLNRFLLRTQFITNDQLGFVPQRSAEDALHNLVNKIKSTPAGSVSAIISLDIKAAFDEAWWPCILRNLSLANCPHNLFGLVQSFLAERTIELNNVVKEISKGCPQGSCSGPALWNTIMATLLSELRSLGVWCQAYADDLILVINGRNSQELIRKANSALAICQSWASISKLHFSIEKSRALIYNVRSRKSVLPITQLMLGDSAISWAEEFTYLGIVIDHKLKWHKHIEYIKSKVARVNNKLLWVTGKNWGMSPRVLKCMHSYIFKPMVLYGASIWGGSVSSRFFENKLRAIQRPFLLKITKAYRTTSNDALEVLSGIPSLSLEARKIFDCFKERKCCPIAEKEVNWCDMVHPSKKKSLEFGLVKDASFSYNADINILTDGSKLGEGVGAGAAVWFGPPSNVPDEHIMLRLDSRCSVFQAESLALLHALRYARDRSFSTIHIFSDSFSALQAITSGKCRKNVQAQAYKLLLSLPRVSLFWIKAHAGLEGIEVADALAKAATSLDSTHFAEIPKAFWSLKNKRCLLNNWQNNWEHSSKGRATFRFVPKVSYLGIDNTFSLTQFLTGHGNFRSYLHRFKIIDSPSCMCGMDETVDHVLFHCPVPARIQARKKLRTVVLSDNKPKPWPLLNSSLLDYYDTVVETTLALSKT